jgi:mono/diheme cytochrome c family protein
MAAMMRKCMLFSLGVLVLALAAGTAIRGQDAKEQRGKFLVEDVARCQECHTPKTETGDFDKSKWLKGAKLEVAPIAAIPGWHAASPDITSTSALWQRWGPDGMTKFLETARNPRGGKAGSPMPAYTLPHADADAIVAYLKSLP